MLMDPLAIPPNAKGHVGLVALLDHVPAPSKGRLVVLREPAGHLTTLVGSKTPVFSWLVHSLGSPLPCKDKASRDGYVPDRCLVPVSSMTPARVKRLVRDDALADFEAAMADLGKILKASTMTREEFELRLDAAARQFAFERCLDVVPIVTVLQEIGFRRDRPDGETLAWAGAHGGHELNVQACQDCAGSWMLVASGRTERRLIWNERLVPVNASRGQVVEVMLAMWLSAFPEAPVPACLEFGTLHRQHCTDMRRVGIELPTLVFDGQLFRRLRKLLIEALKASGEQTVIRLSCSEGMLRIEGEGVALGLSAGGVWVDDREITLNELMNIPTWALRRPVITLRQSLLGLELNGWGMPSARAP